MKKSNEKEPLFNSKSGTNRDKHLLLINDSVGIGSSSCTQADFTSIPDLNEADISNLFIQETLTLLVIIILIVKQKKYQNGN